MGYESIGHHSMVHGLWCMIQSLKSQWFMGYGSPCIIHGVTLMGHRSWVNHSLLNSAHLIGLRRSSFHTLFCGIVNKVQNVGQEGFTSLDICQESNFTIYSRLTVYCIHRLLESNHRVKTTRQAIRSFLIRFKCNTKSCQFLYARRLLTGNFFSFTILLFTDFMSAFLTICFNSIHMRREFASHL